MINTIYTVGFFACVSAVRYDDGALLLALCAAAGERPCAAVHRVTRVIKRYSRQTYNSLDN